MSVGSISNSEIDFSRRKKKKFEIGFFGKVALIGDMCIKGFPFAHQIPRSSSLRKQEGSFSRPPTTVSHQFSLSCWFHNCFSFLDQPSIFFSFRSIIFFCYWRDRFQFKGKLIFSICFWWTSVVSLLYRSDLWICLLDLFGMFF